MAEEDIRQEELSTIAAIYPELQVDDNDPYTVTIELPVSLANPLTVLFPAATEGAPPVDPAQEQVPAVAAIDSQALLNLPSLQVRIRLPEGYPREKPPKADISTSPPWLSDQILHKFESDVETLWEDMGRDQVIFTYIDNLQQSAENVFGLVDDEGRLEIAPEHKIAILDYDIRAKQRAFEKETFECGICLEPKKGLVCHRMIDCKHVFCVQCLQDFYNNAIREGDIAAVQCLQPNCAKEREDAVKGSTKKKKAKTFISPSELLQIPLERETVMRYVMLKHKAEVESDKNTVYCPRSWCQGAARSKKHKKPEGLEFVESSDDDSDAEEAGPKYKPGEKFKPSQEFLAICEDCGYAFCSRCEGSWHGEFASCMRKERKDEITEEEKASLEYLKLHTSPCPTCEAPCQKTHGCNHMRCFRCHSHFCYLCGAWLDPSNPYQHFNAQPSGEVNGCYMRLWELEGGDGDDVGNAFEGRAPGNANIEAGQRGQPVAAVPERGRARHQQPVDNPGNELDGEAGEEELLHQQPRPRDQPNGRVAVAREGPLVLRIEADAPPVQAEEIQRPQPGIPNPRGEAHAPNAGQRRGRGNRRGRGAGINRQNNRNRPQGQNQQIDNNGPNGQNRVRAGDVPQDDGPLNAHDAAWVRRFVQLALLDQEDEFEWEDL
ncbi:RWD-domain-containing protein [Hypoxylon sp. FL0890]|nr:RWD-domain-containing protein [Hypoxylon sp. FL0890]